MEGKPEPTTTPKEETTQPTPQATPAAKQPMFSKKMLLIGSGVIAAIAIIITMLMLLGGPNKSDYNEAVTVMKALREDYKSMDSTMRRATSSMLSSGSSKSETEDISIEKELNSYKENFDKLKGLKALRDKEVKEAYDKLASKNEKFIPYVTSLSESMGDLNKTSKVCGEVSSALRGVNPTSAEQAVSEFDKKTEPCTQALDKLKDVKNKTLADFAGKMRKAIADVREVLGELPALADSQDRSKMYELRSKLMKVVRSLGDETRDFTKKIREEAKENDAADEINALGKLVVQKYNDAK